MRLQIFNDCVHIWIIRSDIDVLRRLDAPCDGDAFAKLSHIGDERHFRILGMTLLVNVRSTFPHAYLSRALT